MKCFRAGCHRVALPGKKRCLVCALKLEVAKRDRQIAHLQAQVIDPYAWLDRQIVRCPTCDTRVLPETNHYCERATFDELARTSGV